MKTAIASLAFAFSLSAQNTVEVEALTKSQQKAIAAAKADLEAAQAVYASIVDRIKAAHGVVPGVITIKPPCTREYATAEINEQKIVIKRVSYSICGSGK